MNRRRSQRGVALLTAIILVALATMLAAGIAFNTAMAARRGSAGLSFDEALQFAGGAEGAAAYLLSDDTSKGVTVDTLEENWALPYGPFEMVPGVQIQAQLTDLNGRFNLNSLVDENGKKNVIAVTVFQRLLENLGLESKWADMVVDWIDADDLAEAQGAEDNIYSSENPPYRPPNAAMTSVSELLALKDFGAQRYEKLKDYVAVLPRAGALDATPINLCTASGELLDALTNQLQFSKNAAGLALLRKGHCWPTASDFTTQNPDAAERDAIIKRIGLGTTSQYFRLTSLVTIGTSQFALYSFLHRTNGSAPGSSLTMVLSRRFTE